MKLSSKFAFILILMAFVVSCGESSKDEKRFFNTYREILIAREVEKDSVSANQKVEDILKKNGYSHESFRDFFLEIANNNKRFTTIIDSLRVSISRDTSLIKNLD